MKKSHLILSGIMVVGILSVGIAYAELQVQDRLIVLSDGDTPIIEFRDQGSKSFHFEIPDGLNRLDIVDATPLEPLTRMTVANWGGVGIGTTAPAEILHVVGNVKLTGDIVGVSGMTIDPNGDLCLGSGCP